ncbi:hypothetical protein HN018_23260 (plasmid) [Lichenicola cladoniae]|uniref:Uncharacterized protein n=1 Tax=Lichenicola cladoniae TaxID=1484109 RepID=A0A6M8HXP4_9PROT|nr:hypothetical protein [Lichenicola cladoniae]NPD66362.1 hypothetical protein [Acetobacteraceae bacterium]QKE93108.1 hypothetical protein HN018_23260 [Lichenicola cladoniae]
MRESTNQDGRKVGNLGGYNTSLLSDCDELVGLIAASNSIDGPYNSIEAKRGSETDHDLAQVQQSRLIDRLEALALQITDRVAVSENEIEGKTQALNALASVDAWERDSLLALRRSIDRDRVDVVKVLHSPLPTRPQPSWVSRCFGLGRRHSG